MSGPEIRAKILLDGSGFQAGLKTASAQSEKFTKDFAKSFSSAFGGAAVAAAITAGVKYVIDYAGHIQDLSDKTGISAENLQKMEYAAKLSGATIEDVTGAFVKLAKAQQEAVKGGKEQISAFESFGITGQQLRTLSVDQLFSRISEEVEKSKDPLEKVSGLLTLLGKGAADLIPAFRSGFGAAMKEIEKVGVIPDEIIAKLDKIGDKMVKLGKIGLKFGAGQISEFADEIEALIALSKIAAGAVLSMSPLTHKMGSDMINDEITSERVDPTGESRIKQLEAMLKAKKDAGRQGRYVDKFDGKSGVVDPFTKALIDTPKLNRGRDNPLNINSLQQIGARVGAYKPEVAIAQESLEKLKEINKRLVKLDDWTGS